MYLKPTRDYCTSAGAKFKPKAPYLLLLRIKDNPATYAAIRKVTLSQVGPWMMGSANLCGKWVPVSGDYGRNGAPLVVEKLPKDAVALPPGVDLGADLAHVLRWAVETLSD